MGRVPFSVSARTAKLIGQENFANAEGAIIELVKNCYDADAKNCCIIFDNDSKFGNTTLYIIDDGVGMTNDVITNQWMKIGTDIKLQNDRTIDGRIKTGAKGIGRFALDRLGESCTMITLALESQDAHYWSVIWSDFEKSGISVNEVEAELNYLGEIDLNQEISKLLTPSSRLKQYLDSLKFNSGTVIKIDSLKDKWQEKDIQSLYNNLEVLLPPKEQPDFKIFLHTLDLPNEFGTVNTAYYDDFDYRVSAKYYADEKNTIKLEITRNELNVQELEDSFGDVFQFDVMKKFPYDIETIKNKRFELNRTLNDFPGFYKNVDKELVKQIGEFEFTFYFLKNRIDMGEGVKFPYKSFSQANRKVWLEKFGGVKIFRDDFRVRPYGEDGQDWLKLGERQARSPGGPGQKLGGYKIRPNQISGTVKISRIANALFQDKSGREGIQENEVFELFRNLLIEIISIFERDRNVIMFNLSELAKRKYSKENERQKAQNEAERILKTQKETPIISSRNPTHETTVKQHTEAEVILANATKMYEQELVDKDEEIKLLRGLASVGLIISSFAHELKSLRSRLVPRTDFLVKELNKILPSDGLMRLAEEDNPLYMIKLIREEDLKLKHWLDYSLSALKRDKRTRTNINIGEYFEKFRINWKMALSQRQIQLTLNGTKENINLYAFEVDLDTIFNNLLSNTLSALKEKKGSYSREVEIKWLTNNESLEIHFSDNGNGLAKEYSSDPNKIFEFNESSKVDRKGNKIGTGMGLYIVKLVIGDYNGADIYLVPSSEGFCVGVKFPLRK